jgi:hypothetical protein
MPITPLDRHHFMCAGSIMCGLGWDGQFYFYAGNLHWAGPYTTITALELDAAAVD